MCCVIVSAVRLDTENQVHYKSDDVDDLLGSIITNKHSPSKTEAKPQGATDLIVQEAYQKAIDDAKTQNVKDVEEKNFKPLSTNDQWAELMRPGGSQLISDPLQEDDIYATVPQESKE